jgi:hypothetical protein
MTDDDDRPLRRVVPRRAVLLGGAVSLGMLATAQVRAQESGEGGEGGEAGEGAAASGLPEDVAFLLSLGLFDATMRIVGALHAEGEAEEAAEQLEYSHHGDYEDLEHGLEEAGIAPFEDEAGAFADAVENGAGAEAVAAALAVVLERTGAAFAGGSAAEQMHAIEVLVRTAAQDYEGGVAEDGEVLSDHEYRDAWGFVETARAELTRLAGDADAAVAGAAERALAALEPVGALFDGLSPARIEGADPSVIYGAAARIEIARLGLG